MSNDQHDDEALFGGFDSLVPTVVASLHAVEQTRRLVLEPVKSHEAALVEVAGKASGTTPPVPQTSLPATDVRQLSRLRALTRYGLAAAVLLVAVLGMYFMVTRNPGDQAVIANNSPHQHSSQEQIAGRNSFDLDVVSRSKAEADSPFLLAKIVPHMRAISAERAPVIVANGGKEPIRLGSATREGAGVLHVWDWSKSPISRMLPDVEFWGTETVALSPDGNHLVWARGDILSLQTGKQTRIDLGGADFKIGESTYGRIGDMRFSPDGSCLALHVTNHEEDIPSRIKSEVVQLVEFPTGRRLCEFPAGESYALRIGFSTDGKQLASADTGRQVLLRDTVTGEVLQRYVPALTSQVMGVAISPDGKYVTATQREPVDLYIWEADSGRLAHRIDGGDFRKHGGYGPFYGVICFSPDSKYLAAELGRLVVFDVTTGAAVVTLPVFTPTNIQWSADGQRVTVVSPVMAGRDWTTGDQTTGGREDLYPRVEIWDWRDNKRIPSFEAQSR